jgi:ribokinase
MPGLTVAVLGGVVQDFTTVCDRLPDDGETVPANDFSMQPGGKGSNSAVAIHRLSRSNPKNTPNADPDLLNLQVRMVGAVGGDQFGPALKENLIKCGINVDGVRIVEGEATAIANILIEADSGANRIMQYPGAAYSLKPEDFVTLNDIGGGVPPDLVVAQLEIGREAIEHAIETAAKLNVEVLLNPSPARSLMPNIYKMITHLVMNETEAEMLSYCKVDDITSLAAWTERATYFHDLGVTNVVITLGDKGAFYSNVHGCGIVEAETNCTVLDTSGAG